MSINRGTYPDASFGPAPIRGCAAVVGAGAAAPTVPATTVYPTARNMVSKVTAEIPTRSGAGVYVIYLDPNMAPPVVDQIVPTVQGSSKQAFITTAYSPSARTVGVSVFTAAGVAADLASGTDLLLLQVFGANSKA